MAHKDTVHMALITKPRRGSGVDQAAAALNEPTRPLCAVLQQPSMGRYAIGFLKAAQQLVFADAGHRCQLGQCGRCEHVVGQAFAHLRYIRVDLRARHLSGVMLY